MTPFIYPAYPPAASQAPGRPDFSRNPSPLGSGPTFALQILPNTAPVLRRENTLRDPDYCFIFRNYRFPGGSGRHPARNSPSETWYPGRVSPIGAPGNLFSDGKPSLYTLQEYRQDRPPLAPQVPRGGRGTVRYPRIIGTCPPRWKFFQFQKISAFHNSYGHIAARHRTRGTPTRRGQKPTGASDLEFSKDHQTSVRSHNHILKKFQTCENHALEYDLPAALTEIYHVDFVLFKKTDIGECVIRDELFSTVNRILFPIPVLGFP